MTTHEKIQVENAYIRSQTGTKPLHAWKHTDDLFLMVQKIREVQGEASGWVGEWDYKSDPETGFILPVPIYVKFPMLPQHKNNWVLCRYHEADQEVSFNQQFGAKMQYPAGGLWQPIECTVMKDGEIPSRLESELAVQGIRANREALRKFFTEGEERQNQREQREKDNFGYMCRSKFSAYLEKPGQKGGTAFQVAGLREDKRIN